jgi:hypothetical protein
VSVWIGTLESRSLARLRIEHGGELVEAQGGPFDECPPITDRPIADVLEL